MALKYAQLTRFVREHGRVKVWAKNGAVTILQSGDLDSVAAIEEDAVRFEHGRKSYTREQFEKLVKSRIGARKG